VCWATGATAAMSGTHYVYTGLLWFQRNPPPNDAPPKA